MSVTRSMKSRIGTLTSRCFTCLTGKVGGSGGSAHVRQAAGETKDDIGLRYGVRDGVRDTQLYAPQLAPNSNASMHQTYEGVRLRLNVIFVVVPARDSFGEVGSGVPHLLPDVLSGMLDRLRAWSSGHGARDAAYENGRRPGERRGVSQAGG